ncbi:CidA/LrgA family protein [Enterococcus songbeiensis]|uniref:CidA/LrgA family protein n=1 Tax=Enterococcus songbeiensis TaxID=2559927 RepID=UPI0010F47DEF|nr:CidA/LrgA family protein [Enterococcus songbeiensis]
MKLFSQFAIVLLFSILGEGLRVVLDLPVPGSIIGIVLLFLAFEFKVVDAKKIEPTCEFLLNNLTILFVPAGVGLMKYYDAIKFTWPILLGIVALCVVATLVTVGKTTEFVEKMLARRRGAVVEEIVKLEEKLQVKGGEVNDL